MFLTLAGSWAVAVGYRRPLCELQVPVLLECHLVPARGLVGSEKVGFFEDERVRTLLARHGLRVEVDPAGSRTMGCRNRVAGYDFAFPGSPWTADAARTAFGSDLKPVPVFESPIVVLTFVEVSEALRGEGVVSDDLQTFDVKHFLNKIFAGAKRWRDLGINQPYPGFQLAIPTSTRLDTSNSAEMYLALVSHVLNDDAPIRPQTAAGVQEAVVDLFRAQGATGLSSEEPFDQYLSSQGYQLPVQVGYEAQFLAAASPGHTTQLGTDVTLPDGGQVQLDRIMLYPNPSAVSIHTLAPANPVGQRVAHALTEDEDLRELIAEYGFRPADDPQTFTDVMRRQGTGYAAAELPSEPISLPPDELWNGFVDGLVAKVYGEDQANAACS